MELEGPDGTRSVAARSVVIATGGFEYDADLVRDFLRGPMRAPAGVPTNTGDGLRMAMRVGAQLGNMREAWWVPVIELPGERADGGNNVFLILRERTLPGSIMVNDQGRRFTNEAANYNALGGAFHAFDPTGVPLRQPALLAGLRRGLRPAVRLLRQRRRRSGARLHHPSGLGRGAGRV